MMSTSFCPETIDALIGREALLMLNGKRKQIKSNDMIMTDYEGGILF
jgi:hypothetical protein